MKVFVAGFIFVAFVMPFLINWVSGGDRRTALSLHKTLRVLAAQPAHPTTQSRRQVLMLLMWIVVSRDSSVDVTSVYSPVSKATVVGVILVLISLPARLVFDFA
jgi:hypothetical protein